MSSGILVVDIGRDQVACVLMTYGIKAIKIEYLSNGPRQAPDESGIFSGCRSVLSDLTSHIGPRFDKCLVSIPADYFSFRPLALPFKSSQKINQILGHELEKYLPLDATAFDPDFYLLVKNTPKGSKQTRIAAAGLYHTTFEAVTSLTEGLDLLPDVLTPGSGYSSAQVVAQRPETSSGLVFFLYIETGAASIHVIRNGEIVHTRTVLIDCDTPVPDIGRHLTHTYHWISERFDCDDPLSLIVLSGSTSTVDPYCSALSQSLGVSVHPFDLFECVKKKWTAGPDLPPLWPQDCNGQCQNALAMGINEMQGTKGYNFSRRNSDLTHFFQEHGTRLAASLALFVVLAITFTLYSMANINAMEKEINRLDTEITHIFTSVFPDAKTIVDPVAQMQVELEALQAKKNTGNMDGHLLNIDLLNEISRTLPVSLDIEFTRFIRSKNSLRITGSADQFNTIDKMKHAFENRFADVEIHSAAMDKKKNRVTFNVTILLGTKVALQ